MDLRSGSRSKAEEDIEVDIPMILPRTQAITFANASSPLLKLPAELKNKIYELVLGGKFLHVLQTTGYGAFLFYPCQATISESTLEQRFVDSATGLQPQYVQRHHGCIPANPTHLRMSCTPRLALSAANRELAPRAPCSVLPAAFELTMLRTCRQLYNEAKYILWESTVFSFDDPKVLRNFMYDVQQRPASNVTRVRSLHLDIVAQAKADEQAWNAALRVASRRLSGLSRLHVSIDQQYHCSVVVKVHSWWHAPALFQHFSDPNTGRKGKNTFFKGLYALKALPIETVTMVVYSTATYSNARERKEGGWTHAQRQVWARYVKDALLERAAIQAAEGGEGREDNGNVAANDQDTESRG